MKAIEFHWKVMDTICRFKTQTETVLQPFCTKNSITPLQMHILFVLYFEGSQTVTTLARRICTAGANNSVLCKRLANEGYLSRKRDEKDERQVMIEILPKGKSLVEEFARYSEEECKNSPLAFTPEELKTMLENFTQFLAIVEKNHNKEIEP